MRRSLTAVVLLLAGCGGGGSSASFAEVLEDRYPPLTEAADAAVEPCLAESFEECATRMQAFRERASALVEELSDAESPEGLEDAAATLDRGLRQLVDVLGEAIVAAEAADGDDLAALRPRLNEAGVDVNNAIGTVNAELGTQLPTL